MKPKFVSYQTVYHSMVGSVYLRMLDTTTFADIVGKDIELDPEDTVLACQHCAHLEKHKVVAALAVIRKSDAYPKYRKAPANLIPVEYYELILSDVRIQTILDNLDSKIVKEFKPH